MRAFTAALALAVLTTAACSTADSPTGAELVRGPVNGYSAESPNGAWVRLEGNACGMVGSDANGQPIFGGPGTLLTKVENNNKLTIMCKGSGIANLRGRTTVLHGFPCSISGLKDGGVNHLTIQSHATITKDGDATLTCIASL